ncbi:hypothetical protein AALC25_05175 [Lachnospiraceae bacterium 29-84]
MDMNIFTVSTGQPGTGRTKTGSIYAGNLQGIHNSALKSTQEKMQRQQEAANEIQFWEGRKENLKQMECGTVEEISRKLEMFHSYEDEIAAVKAAYNNEQIGHILDEAREQGEKNAEAAKKLEPKTAEERREELAEEALGTEEEGILDEALDEVTEVAEELQEAQEEVLEELQDEVLGGLQEPGEPQELDLEELQKEQVEEPAKMELEDIQKKELEEEIAVKMALYRQGKEDGWQKFHKAFDAKV